MDIKTIYRIAATAVACVIGAGFVSGQEVWQFFGVDGWFGILPIAIAVILFGVGAAVVLWYARETNAENMEVMVSPTNHPVAKWGVIIFENVLHYAFYISMAAATGALFSSVGESIAMRLGSDFSIPNFVGILFFCVVSTTVSMLGIKGLTKVFGWLVPILAVAIIAVAIASLFLPDTVLNETGAATSPLVKHWSMGAILYFCFNFVGSVPILVAAAKGEKTRGMSVGALLAILPLGALAICLYAAVVAHPGSAYGDLPMMVLASELGASLEYICAVLMLGGIFSTGFSSQGSINDYMMHFGLKNKKLLLLATVALSGVAFLVALNGFSEFIGVMYPILGFAGIVPLVIIFVRAGILFVQKHMGKKRASTAEKEL